MLAVTNRMKLSGVLNPTLFSQLFALSWGRRKRQIGVVSPILAPVSLSVAPRGETPDLQRGLHGASCEPRTWTNATADFGHHP